MQDPGVEGLLTSPGEKGEVKGGDKDRAPLRTCPWSGHVTGREKSATGIRGETTALKSPWGGRIKRWRMDRLKGTVRKHQSRESPETGSYAVLVALDRSKKDRSRG